MSTVLYLFRVERTSGTASSNHASNRCAWCRVELSRDALQDAATINLLDSYREEQLDSCERKALSSYNEKVAFNPAQRTFLFQRRINVRPSHTGLAYEVRIGFYSNPSVLQTGAQSQFIPFICKILSILDISMQIPPLVCFTEVREGSVLCISLFVTALLTPRVCPSKLVPPE